MIFAFLDDGGVRVHDSLSDVQREHEPIDVENGDVRFFDRDGHPLEPVFTEPNRRRKLIGSVEVVQQGAFTLQAVKDPSASECLGPLLRDAAYLHPNRRTQAIHRVGNLTLLTKELNPSVSNGPWSKKRDKILEHSALNLNRPFKDHSVWDEDLIEERSKTLFNVAVKIWPRP